MNPRGWWGSAWCLAAAFGTYVGMYPFRNPFTAAGVRPASRTRVTCRGHHRTGFATERASSIARSVTGSVSA